MPNRISHRDQTPGSEKKLSYIIITPAKNEEAFIEGTIKSVLQQTLTPRQWVIVDDGSTDRTIDIVRGYQRNSNLISLVSTKRSGERDFGSKARAFKLGLEVVGKQDYDFIGNLDADVTFSEDYYQSIVQEFEDSPELGIAGGMIQELIDGHYLSQRLSLNSVAGAVQLFRRKCFEDVGGYLAIKSGGIDAAAEIIARARGWNVRTFSDLSVFHHRRVTTGTSSVCLARYRQGMTNYRLGYDPTFQFVSSLYRMSDRPFLLGGAMAIVGYLTALLRREGKILPEDVRRHLRSEQRKRLRELAFRRNDG